MPHPRPAPAVQGPRAWRRRSAQTPPPSARRGCWRGAAMRRWGPPCESFEGPLAKAVSHACQCKCAKKSLLKENSHFFSQNDILWFDCTAALTKNAGHTSCAYPAPGPKCGCSQPLTAAYQCQLPLPRARCTHHVAHFNSQVALAIGLAHVADEVMMVVAMAYSRTVTQGSNQVNCAPTGADNCATWPLETALALGSRFYQVMCQTCSCSAGTCK